MSRPISDLDMLAIELSSAYTGTPITISTEKWQTPWKKGGDRLDWKRDWRIVARRAIRVTEKTCYLTASLAS